MDTSVTMMGLLRMLWKLHKMVSGHTLATVSQRAGGRNLDVRSSQCRAMHPFAGYRAVFIARAGDARGRRTDFWTLLE